MVKVTKKVSKEEYKLWEVFVDSHPECTDKWVNCDDCEGDLECDQCGWNLVGLEGQATEFLERVKLYVEGTVEELYLHPDWTDSEREEYGVVTEYLVKLYCKYYMQ